MGVDALPVKVESHIEFKPPRHHVVGLPDNSVRESLHRVLAAMKNSGFSSPGGAITVNLAPADVRKEGTLFDLPMALAMIASSEGNLPQKVLDQLYVVGELSLDGTVRPVRGVLPVAVRALQDGRRGILVPSGNAAEAAVVEGLSVYPVARLEEAYEFIRRRGQTIAPFRNGAAAFSGDPVSTGLDFADVRGQENVKRALEVAAAGRHNVLMIGPPGAGKTMLARRLPSLLPLLSTSEALETTKIHSVGGKLKDGHGLVHARPFRAPHHTISDVGLCGGGSNPMPGEISLAHHGVLFLDELPEFKRQVLEVLRQPIEEGSITISRARVSVDYPASFMLVAGMNPCPCGYLNDLSRECVCTPVQIQRYLARISGPLLDRIDLHIEVTPVPFEQLNRRTDAEPSSAIRERIVAARKRQTARLEGVEGIYANGQMTPRMVRRTCRLDRESQELMKLALRKLGLSARAYDRILKVSRTIADLAGSEDIRAQHVSEAVQYRSLDRNWGG